MGETGRQTLTPVSDVMLARYVAGDLHGDQLARVESAIGETPGLADRLERMRSERTAFLANDPPEQVAHQIVTRLTVEKPQPSRWQVWWLLPPVSVATALLIGVVYQRALGPQPLVAPVQVTTDDSYVLPDGQSEARKERNEEPQLAAPGAAPEAEPARAVDAKADKPADDKLRRRAGKGAAGASLEGAAGEVADRDAPKNGALGRLTGDDGLAAHGSGGGAGVASGRGRNYAQPPPATKTPAGPTTPAPVSPPVWAEAPPDSKPSSTPAQAQAPANKPAPRAAEPAKPAKKSTATTESSTAEPAPAAAPRPTAGAPAPPREADVGLDQASAAAADSSSTYKSEEKAKARVMDDERRAVSEKEDARAKDAAPADGGVVSVTLTRAQSGHTRVVSTGEIVGGGSLLKVTAQGGKHVTVIGVRRDGAPHVYAQSDAGAPGQLINLMLRVRPTSARASEALFVIVGEAPLTVGTSMVSGAKDAAQLPLRLAVPGTQRRFVIAVSAAAD